MSSLTVMGTTRDLSKSFTELYDAIEMHQRHWQSGHACSVYATCRLPIWSGSIFSKYFEAFEVDLKVCSARLPSHFLFFDTDARGKVPNPSGMQEAIDAGKESVVGG
jgi:hypothetical protein